MTDFLETTVDKFIFKVATDRYYSREGLWARADGDHVRIGLSDFLQQRSGDVAFAEIKPPETVLAPGDEVASIETIKVTISLSSPITGRVWETNPAMGTSPEVINQDPYGAGWLAVIEANDWEADRATLLDPQAYFLLMKGQAEEETPAVMEAQRKVVIVPCSGIGKTYGTVSREAAYEVTEDIRADQTQLVALSLLVLGDEETRAVVDGNPVITIDGCKLACATKMARESGGTVVQDFAVLDVYRRYKQFKPQGIAALNEGGRQLAHVMAEEIATVVDTLTGNQEGGTNA